MYVLGTAGHVDHGKSTLIKTLTGIDPDRLREEKERQMTIDLGFAWLKLPSGSEIGIVDVPGHRDFIENMLAGIGGIDAVLLVIAADEGIMPQTRDHLAIIDLLEITCGIVVLTKIDAVDDPEWIGLVKDDIKKFLLGTSIEDSEIIAVSSITREGVDTLISSIETLFNTFKPKNNIGKPRLPIDRVFTLKGFGTVVTGTQLDGSFQVGQQVLIQPGQIQSRIRSIQTHKRKTDVIEPGNRAALNLVGVEVDQLKRGQTVILPRDHTTTRRVDVRFKMISDASGKLEHDDIVKIFSGTSQMSSRVRLIGDKKITGGENAFLQLEFEEDVLLVTGDHYVLRRPSPAETIGGGIILNAHSKQRYKRFSQNTLDLFKMLEEGSHADRIMIEIRKQGFIYIEALKDEIGLSMHEIETGVKELLDFGYASLFFSERTGLNENSLLIDKEHSAKLGKEIIAMIEKFHIEHPLRPGIKKEAIRTALNLDPRLFQAIMGILLRDQDIQDINGLISHSKHQTQLTGEQEEQIQNLINTFEKSPYTPPSLADLQDKFDNDLLQYLIDKGKIIETSDQILFRDKDFEEMHTFTIRYLKEHGSISIGQFRDHFNTSRKFALSFLEYLDASGVTDRKEDVRVLKIG